MSNLFQEKLEQAANYLRENDLDMWLIYTSEGSDPCVSLVTGLKTVGKTFFMILRDGRRFVIASSIDAQESEGSGLFDEVYKYGGGCEELLLETMKKLNPAKIAINYSVEDHLCDGLTLGRYRWLCKAVGETFASRFVSSEPFLKKLRSIKAPGEIACIQKAIDITLAIYDEVFAGVKIGMTELEIGELFLEGMRKRDVVNGITKKMTMPIIMKERLSHRDPGNARIEGGDFLIFDYSVAYQGYVSDIARTCYILKPGETKAPAEFEKRFRGAHEAITKVAEAIRPGMQGHELDTLAREHLLSKGLPAITHATGHQIGRECHDGGTMLGPRWERYGNAPYGIIEENNVFTIEPTVLYFEGGYSVLTEENILVTKDGGKFLSKRQDDLVLIKG